MRETAQMFAYSHLQFLGLGVLSAVAWSKMQAAPDIHEAEGATLSSSSLGEKDGDVRNHHASGY